MESHDASQGRELRRNMLLEAIENWASCRGSDIAISSDTKSLTYAELWSHICITADRLTALGIDGSLPISVHVENRVELMLVYYAVAKLGGSIIPINSSLSQAEVEYILDHGEVVALFYDSKTEAMALTALAGRPHLTGWKVEEFFSGQGKTTKVPPSDLKEKKFPFLMVYTSGSTGTPKGVGIDQGDEYRGNASLIEMWGVTPSDVMSVALPMGWHYGLTTTTGMMLQAGGTVHILNRFHPKLVLESFINLRVSIYAGVPTMYAMMLEYAEQNNLSIDLSNIRMLISAGAPLQDSLVQKFKAKFNKSIVNYYAQTESRPLFGVYFNETAQTPIGTVGKLAPQAIAKILDENGRELPTGKVGELYIRGASATSGYIKDAIQTAELYHDGLIKSGDLGYVNADGYYFLVGRSKDVIIRGGANIAPIELENIIGQFSEVNEVAVVGVPDDKYGQLVCVCVVLKKWATISLEEIKGRCEGKVASFKIPDQLRIFEKFPMGATGKIDKKALLKQAMDS